MECSLIFLSLIARCVLVLHRRYGGVTEMEGKAQLPLPACGQALEPPCLGWRIWVPLHAKRALPLSLFWDTLAFSAACSPLHHHPGEAWSSSPLALAWIPSAPFGRALPVFPKPPSVFLTAVSTSCDGQGSRGNVAEPDSSLMENVWSFAGIDRCVESSCAFVHKTVSACFVIYQRDTIHC